MRSFQVQTFGKPLCEAVTPTPVPQCTEVVVKITACGVCHSDVHLWDGYFDLGGGKKLAFGGGRADVLPLTLGHEPAGEVVAVGPDAKGVKVGDRGIVYPWIGCGECSICKSGDEHLCNKPAALGIQKAGGYADHMLVPHPRYIVDFKPLPDTLACTYACSGVTAYSALLKAGKLGDKDPLLIVGAGGVGLNGVRLAKAVTGVAPYVADIDPRKKDAALAAGAREFIDASQADAGRNFVKATGGAAVAIDYVGGEASAQLGFGAIRKGGKLVVVGLFGGTFTTPVPMFVMRAVTIQGSYVGSLAEFRALRDLVVSGALPPMPIATRPLAEAGRTIEDLKAGKIVGRVVLQP